MTITLGMVPDLNTEEEDMTMNNHEVRELTTEELDAIVGGLGVDIKTQTAAIAATGDSAKNVAWVYQLTGYIQGLAQPYD